MLVNIPKKGWVDIDRNQYNRKYIFQIILDSLIKGVMGGPIKNDNLIS